MTKVDIYSGFLGAGKTTLIKKLIKEAYVGQKIVLIENEFGQIGIDGGFLKEAGIEITEMNSGCICCSLVGDFSQALAKVEKKFSPDRIVIEPSGVGKLSDVIKAVENAGCDDLTISALCAVIDAGKCKMYMKNFAEFYRNQIEYATAIVLSRIDGIREDKLKECIDIIRSVNEHAPIVTTPWDQVDGKAILSAAENKDTLEERLHELMHEHHEHEHHHHDHKCNDPECECHHHHDHEHECDDPECECHHHHEHHHDHDCDCHEHEHHHDHDCGCHEHHHHADEVFTSWGRETAKKFTKEQIVSALSELDNEEKYGIILRAKGIVASVGTSFIHFDYVPGEPDVREGSAAVTGRLCVIGSKINEEALAELFGI